MFWASIGGRVFFYGGFMIITNLINSALKKEQEDRKDRVSRHLISPSSFGKCWRYQIWKRQGKEPSNPIDDRLLRVFKAGTIFHNWVQGLLEGIETEVVVEKDDILGFADIVNSDEVVDIKTQHSRAFHWMNKTGYDVNKEKYGNILQVICYAWILGKSKARLVFLSKDDLCIAEYLFPVSEWVDRLLMELTTLRALWKSGVTPNAEPRAYKTECCQKNGAKPCSFYEYCREELCSHKSLTSLKEPMPMLQKSI